MYSDFFLLLHLKIYGSAAPGYVGLLIFSLKMPQVSGE